MWWTGSLCKHAHVQDTAAVNMGSSDRVLEAQSNYDPCPPLVQLVKSGADDLRQDAVMQQLFGLVNSFLRASAPTRQRSLQIAVYKVGTPPC